MSSRQHMADARRMIRALLRADDFVRMPVFHAFPDAAYESAFMGTVFALDPCGRYACGRDDCEAFWLAVETAADECGMWIESGEGDPCDVFLCRAVRTEVTA